MTSLSVNSKGHSPKKVPFWVWIVGVLLVLVVLGNAITLAIAEMLRDAILTREAAVELAHQSGDPDVETDNALAAQELQILLESLRGSLNSASYPL